MLSRFSALRRLTAINLPQTFVKAAGLQTFEQKPNFDNVEFPERQKLLMYPKVPQYPAGLKPFKMQRKLRLMRGPEEYHNTLLHRQFGVVATIGGRLRHEHFELIRLSIARKLPEKAFAVWRVQAPWQPVSKKGHGHRMGGGKANIHHYVTPIKAGRIIFEIGGYVELTEVKKLLNGIACRMPFKAKVITQEELDREREKQKWLEENNQNYWTYKYIVQNNLLGCGLWICPTDRKWFGKHR